MEVAQRWRQTIFICSMAAEGVPTTQFRRMSGSSGGCTSIIMRPVRTDRNSAASKRGNKFIYPAEQGYPGYDGRVALARWTPIPNILRGRAPLRSGILHRGAGVSGIAEDVAGPSAYALGTPTNRRKLGPRSPTSTSVSCPNRWQPDQGPHRHLSSTSGTFEAWMKPLGGKSEKIAEWIGGVTPRFRLEDPERSGGT